MELKKSYKGLFLWFAGLFIVSFLISCLPLETDILVRLLYNEFSIGMAFLTYHIYKTEYIYWYTGIEYRDAKYAGTERRKAYARAHFQKFRKFAIVFFILSTLSYTFKLSHWIDFTVFFIGILATAFSTIKIKL